MTKEQVLAILKIARDEIELNWFGTGATDSVMKMDEAKELIESKECYTEGL